MKKHRLLCLTLFLSLMPVPNQGLYAQAPTGLKKRVAVADFKDKSAHSAPWWDNVGSGMADMVGTALTKSGKCLVLEREQLGLIQKEQQLAVNGTMLASTAAPKGKLTGASLILTGDVTEFGIRHQDVGVGALSRVLPFGGNASIQRETARCVLDLRLVDTTTGHVIAAEKAEGEVSAHHLHEDLDVLPSVKIGTERFDETLLGKATRQAVDRAVALIEKHLDSLPWYGRIVKTDDTGKLFVNTGLDDGRGVGQEFDVVRTGETMFDPDSGETLGAEKTPVGRIRLVAILGPRLARAVSIEGSTPEAGDVIQ